MCIHITYTSVETDMLSCCTLQCVKALYSFNPQHTGSHTVCMTHYHMHLVSHLVTSMQAVPTKSNSALQYLNSHKAARLGLYGAAIVLAGTLLVAAFRVFRKYNAPQNKRKRNVSKNKVKPFWCTDSMMCSRPPLRKLRSWLCL